MIKNNIDIFEIQHWKGFLKIPGTARKLNNQSRILTHRNYQAQVILLWTFYVKTQLSILEKMERKRRSQPAAMWMHLTIAAIDAALGNLRTKLVTDSPGGKKSIYMVAKSQH